MKQYSGPRILFDPTDETPPNVPSTGEFCWTDLEGSEHYFKDGKKVGYSSSYHVAEKYLNTVKERPNSREEIHNRERNFWSMMEPLINTIKNQH